MQNDIIVNIVFIIFIIKFDTGICIFPYIKFPTKNTINKKIISQIKEATIVIIKLEI